MNGDDVKAVLGLTFSVIMLIISVSIIVRLLAG